MADEAFALSPIAARAAQPSEADYDAIREAFMETARGRWFLSEYGKRNRNADTSMVLDAVARIEQRIAAQKQPPVAGLADSLTAICAMVDEAKAAAAQAITSTETHPTLTAARDGARIVREVAFTLRECGADIRICDLLDAQLARIDAGQQQIAAIAHREAILAAFDGLMQRIGKLAGEAEPPSNSVSQAGKAAEEFSASSRAAAPAALGESGAAIDPVDIIARDDGAETCVSEAPGDEVQASTLPVSGTDGTHAEFEQRGAEDAHDDAVLDLIAMEMAEPDLAENDIDLAPEISSDVESPRDSQPAIDPPMAAAADNARAPSPVARPSLGSVLIASGVVPRPAASGADPLAPIRRMSQAERIAFFS